MHPIFMHIGPLTIHTYGVLAALAFVAALFLATREARRKGIDPERITDLCLYILIAAILGARLLEVIVEWRYYSQNPAEMLMVWKGGLVFYGGFIGATAVSVLYLRRHSLPVWKVGDALAPSIAIGQAIGRIGCFFAGCCHGAPTNLPWAVTFTDPDSLAVLNVPVHPTQIYESIGTAVLFVLLWSFRKRVRFDGQLFWSYVLGYSVLRFVLEFFRGDIDRGFVALGPLTLSTSQLIALAAFTASIAAFAVMSRAAGKQAST
ncbi:MAG TPA: prolipoprotein diacylglyceryl transferase [Nitrospirota bacterium]|jgi:phosphatidylglycerol:prolipoprotein diacylglycerol transferase